MLGFILLFFSQAAIAQIPVADQVFDQVFSEEFLSFDLLDSKQQVLSLDDERKNSEIGGLELSFTPQIRNSKNQPKSAANPMKLVLTQMQGVPYFLLKEYFAGNWITAMMVSVQDFAKMELPHVEEVLGKNLAGAQGTKSVEKDQILRSVAFWVGTVSAVFLAYQVGSYVLVGKSQKNLSTGSLNLFEKAIIFGGFIFILGVPPVLTTVVCAVSWGFYISLNNRIQAQGND